MEQEQKIINLAKSGDSAAFSILVNKYSSLVFTFAYRILENREDAEEAAQDAFLKAWKYLNGYKGDSKFSTWLCSITRNTALTKLERRKKKIQPEELNKHYILQTNNEDDDKNEILSKAIQQLSVEDAQLITLFYQSEQSIADIAKIMNLEVGNVKVKLHRARLKLKEITELLMTKKSEL